MLLYGLTVVVASGLTGLIGRLLEGAALARADEAELARNLAFTVVGVPLCAVLALWSRRGLAANLAEARSRSWACYVTAASLTTLVVTMMGAVAVLRWALGLTDYSGPALAQPWSGARCGLATGGSTGASTRQSTPSCTTGGIADRVGDGHGRAQRPAGGRTARPRRTRWGVLTRGGDPILQGLLGFVAGAVVWVGYWARTAVRQERDPLWLAYVLLIGVAGGLVTALVAASALLYPASSGCWARPGPRLRPSILTPHPARRRWRPSVGWSSGTTTPCSRRAAKPHRGAAGLRVPMAAVGLAAAAGGLVTLWRR